VRRRATLVVGDGSQTEVAQKDFDHLNWEKGVGSVYIGGADIEEEVTCHWGGCLRWRSFCVWTDFFLLDGRFTTPTSEWEIS